jgi:hypothetical protein
MSKDIFPRKAEFPEGFLDLIFSIVRTKTDKKSLFFSPHPSADTFKNKLNRYVPKKFPGYSFDIFLVQNIPEESRYKSDYRLLVFYEDAIIDLLTGIYLGVVDPDAYVRIYSTQDGKYVSLEGPTLFDKYLENKNWQQVSEFLQVCADMAEEKGFGRLSKVLTTMSRIKDMEKILSLIPDKLLR